MFSPALTSAPTINTIGRAAITYALPTILFSGNVKKGIQAALLMAIIGAAGNAFSALQNSYDPMILATGGFVFGFIVQYVDNNDLFTSLLNGIIWSATLTTPAVNLLVNNTARLGTRSYIYLSNILIEAN